ncbi:hypothetical protein ABES25_08775 [Bacillus gobiensis]|uniref:hypothetical protein n=2 Tax=Bacillus gobiensis TaxID=1441095 RepID=UPI003D229C3B
MVTGFYMQFAYGSNLSIDEAVLLERDLIAQLKPCCNISKGGDRTNGEKISKALTGKSHTSEHKRKSIRSNKKMPLRKSTKWKKGIRLR